MGIFSGEITGWYTTARSTVLSRAGTGAGTVRCTCYFVFVSYHRDTLFIITCFCIHGARFQGNLLLLIIA